MTSAEDPRDPPRVTGQPRYVADPSFVVQNRRDLHLDESIPNALRQAIHRMSETGPNAETAYQAALDGLRSQSGAGANQVISAAIEELPEEAYLERLLLVQVAADVGEPELVELFRTVVTDPLPPERSSDADYKFTTRGREVIIRTTAVDGLARLAAEGSTIAVDYLLENVAHENRTVRAACVVALQGLGGAPASRVRERVGADDRDLLELRRMRVEDVPQPNAGTYVRHPGAKGDDPPRP